MPQKILQASQKTSDSPQPQNLTDLPAELLQHLLRLVGLKGQAAALQTSRSLRGHLDVIQKVNGLETDRQKKWVHLQLKHKEERVSSLIDNLDTSKLTTKLQQMVNEVQERVCSVLTEIGQQTQVTEAVKQKILNQPRVWACLDNKLDKFILVGDTSRVYALFAAGANPITTRSLELAAEFGDGNMVNCILRHGAVATPRALELAAEFGDGNMVNGLLGKGAVATPRALELAVEFGDGNMVYGLLRNGAVATPRALEIAAASRGANMVYCMFYNGAVATPRALDLAAKFW